MEWRLLDTGNNNAFYNMAVDEAIMRAYQKGLVPPTIRFYQWSPPGLSLGYSQHGNKEVDKEVCRQYNIDIVRRLTGGRAILHDDEQTYSIIIGEDYLPEGVLASYKIISNGIMKGLKAVGLKAELKPVEKGKKAPKGFSAACFDAPSWYEVVVGGKKLVGSAQTRKKGTILQHGSIPFSMDVDILYKVLKLPGEKIRERMKKRFLQKATAINWESDKEIDPEELKDALIKGWEEQFAITLKHGVLIDEEKELIQKLVVEKYETKDWNFRR